MAGSIDTLSLLMLCFGLLGIVVTLVMALKSRQTRQSTQKSPAGRAQFHLRTE
ncbi:hypothetical protein [Janthinobacterium sp. 17J80-10]|uniref:hypothetical protein n=1 Tax=Janthinobacterium sp. 17J80-10 TaxID=2497863 RepID=UPI0013E8C514|nr:hypothetical protein [Janthinobacterium sp. 17J80-10]